MIDSDKKDKYPKGELTRWLADAVQQWEAEQSLIDRQEKHESHKGSKMTREPTTWVHKFVWRKGFKLVPVAA